MSVDNTNLEDMVEKTLESTGVLSKMRAELRANVFHVLEKGSSFQNKLYTDKINDFVSNNNGTLLLSLVKDLFEYLELTFTTSVFDSETGAAHQYQYIDKDDIFEELSLSKDDKRPLLLQILETYQSQYKPTNDVIKHNATQHNSETHNGPLLAQISKNNVETIKSTLDNNKSPVKTKLFEESTHYEIYDNHAHLGSLTSSNLNLSDHIIQFQDIESSAYEVHYKPVTTGRRPKLIVVRVFPTVGQSVGTSSSDGLLSTVQNSVGKFTSNPGVYVQKQTSRPGYMICRLVSFLTLLPLNLTIESLNSLSIEQLSPIKIPPTIDQNENTDEDIKSDLKSNKNESSLEDIETDENLSCGNDSLPSTDLSTQNGSPEKIRTHNIHL